MIARVSRQAQGLWQSRLVRNALGLYVLQIGSWLLPIATVIFLARRLGPQNWGSLAFMQAFGTYVIFLIGYGFNYSATREVARHREDRSKLAELLAGVQGAKLTLTALSLLIVIPVSILVPAIHRNQGLLWPAMLWAFAWGFTPSWYFQGLERMWFVARIDTLARFLSLAGILIVVRSPGDTWKVLTLQGGFLLLATVVELAVAYREVGFMLPGARLVGRTLRLGWSMFLLSGALSFYTIGNGFILGLLGSTSAVAFFVAGERICKTFGTLLLPLTQAVFPRTSHLAATDRRQAARLARTSLLLMGAAGIAWGIGAFLFAPVLVHLLFGPGFEPAIAVLRILALLPPLVAVSNVIGVQWMLAIGLDRLVNAVVFSAGVLNILLAIILVPHLMQIGMAIAVVAAEAVLTLGLYAVLRIKHLDPLVIATRRAQEETVPVSVPA
jgi:PST family polysaccharide transporter